VKKRNLIYHRLGQYYFKTCEYPWLIIGLFSVIMEFKNIHRIFDNNYKIISFRIYCQHT